MLSDADDCSWRLIISKTILLTALLFLFALPASAQEQMFLELSGYVGGEGNEQVNAVAIKQVDNRKFLYVAGNSTSKQSWMPSGPRRGAIAPGCGIKRFRGKATVQCTGAGPDNAFVARYTNGGEPTGFAFIGGPGGRSSITDIAVTEEGEVYVSGWTTDELPNAGNRYNGGSKDAFVAKIDTSKLDPRDTVAALEESPAVTEWIWHLGGEDEDEAMAIDININGFPIVAGNTSSRDFPTRGAESGGDTGDIGDTPVGKVDFLQPSYSNQYRGGASDAFVTIIDSEGDRVHTSYYLGGNNADGALDLNVASQAIYIAGSTASAHITTPWGRVEGGTESSDQDAFLYRNNIVPTAKDTGRIVGGSDSEQEATGVELVRLSDDRSGVVLAGNTGGSLLPDFGMTENMPELPVDTGLPEYHGGDSDGFLLLYESLSADTPAPEKMKYLGASGTDRIEALQVWNGDESDDPNVYVVGSTDSDFFPAAGDLPAPMKRSSGGNDAFMVMLDKWADKIQYSGRHGGSSSDRGLDLAVSDRKIFNMVGTTGSNDLPFKRNPERSINGGTDGFLARLTPVSQRATNLSVSASSPTEFHGEEAPVPFEFTITNTEDTDASDVELTATFSNGTITSTPRACRNPEYQKVICSYGTIAGNRGEYHQTIEIDPSNPPEIIKGTFAVESASREYHQDDNRATSTAEVITAPDIQIESIEITQGIQDKRQSVPLLQDKTTYARVYVKAVRKTVGGGTRLVNIDDLSAELTGWNSNGDELLNAPISPVSTSPTTLEQVEDQIDTVSVNINYNDRILGRRAEGTVGSGNDGFRYTGNRPVVSLDNPGNAKVLRNHEGTVIITGNTSYTIKAEDIKQEGHQINHYNVDIESGEDEVEGDIARGSVSGEDADGFIYKDGTLEDIELSNPSQATVLVEDRGTIVIKSDDVPGSTDYTILGASELDANTQDRTRRETFDFRLPNEWVNNEESIRLQATVNPDRSFSAETVTLNNDMKSDTEKLWNLAPICVITQSVKTNDGGPNPDLTETDDGRSILSLGETLLPTPEIETFPNNNAIEPGWAEAGDTFEFDEPNNNFDSGKVLTLLQWRANTQTAPNWCNNRGARTHWSGLVNPVNVDGPGGTARGNQAFWFSLSGNASDWNDINSPYGGVRLAHELSHNYDLGHVRCGGPNDPYENYPFNDCRLGPIDNDSFFGYDTRDPDDSATPFKGGQRGIHPHLRLPFPRLDGYISDLMSYADHRWTSSYTWVKLFIKYNREPTEPPLSKINPALGRQPPTSQLLSPTRGAPAHIEANGFNDRQQAGPAARAVTPYHPWTVGQANAEDDATADQQALPDQLVVVNGILDVNREQFSQLEAMKMNSTVLVPRQARKLLESDQKNPDYPLRIELHSEEGEILESRFVELQRDHDGGSPAERAFFTALPWNPEAAQVEISMFGNRLAGKTLEGPAPVVKIEEPSGGESFDRENFTVRWSVAGVDQPDEVRYMVHYSPDGGASWHPLSINRVSENMNLLPADLPGSTDRARIRVTAIYNGRSSTALSEPFSVAGHAPETKIFSPDSTARIRAGGQVYLDGQGYDIDEGYLTGDNLQWTITAQDSNLTRTASGEEKTLFGLPAGSYKATLTATDADGMQSTDTRYFVIGPVDSVSFETKGEKRRNADEDGKEREQDQEGQPSIDQETDEEASLFLIPRGGTSMPGVSSLGGLAGGTQATLEGQQSVLSWGGSLVLGSRDGLNLRLTGLHRSGTIATVLQNDQVTTTEIDEKFTAFSAELVLRPFPRILVQPYAVGGIGLRKITQEGQTTTDAGSGWKTAFPIGAGIDLQVSDGGVVLGVEAVDYISNFSGEGQARHDAFLMGYIGIPLF